ncbi:MAG: Hpt domain-containing protein, partial [Caldimonas sp.]
RDEVDGLASTEVDPARVVQAGVFDRLAGNLSALGFLIDMLSVQPQMAKSLFAYDAETGVLSPVMGRAPDAEHMSIGVPGLAPSVEPRLLEQAQMLAFSSVRDDVPLLEITHELERLSHEAQAADQPGLAATVLKAQEAFGRAGDAAGIATARGELSEALVDFVATASEPDAILPEPALAPRAMLPPTLEISDFQEDDEMRGIFLEEAREVIQDAGVACRSLERAPADLALLTALRRGFHTLKGSSRMVGLKAFGEAAWACEQVFNSQLAEQRAAEPPLIEFAAWALGELGRWVEDIAAGNGGARSEGEIKIAADRISHRMQTGEDLSDISLPMGLPPDLPSRADLDLGKPKAAEPEPTEVSFELDLSGLDRLEPQEPAVSSPAVPPGAGTSAMFDRFDDAPTDAMQTTLANTQFMREDVADGGLDLDLGAAETPSLFEPIAPSAATATASVSAAAKPDIDASHAADLTLDFPAADGLKTSPHALPEPDDLSFDLGADIEIIEAVAPPDA